MKCIAHIMILSCLVLGVHFLTGCGKDEVAYENISDGLKPEGNIVGGSTNNSSDLLQDDFARGDLESLEGEGNNLFSEDPTSKEYMAMYGRSTAPLLPVYFDFDSSSIKEDQLANLNKNGAYILENKSMTVTIEGNCDQRGTADYNLALGELRAINVKKYLVNFGIEKSRLSTVSFGSERPLYTENTEKAWAANRRADLILQ